MIAIGYNEEHGYLWSCDCDSTAAHNPTALAKELIELSQGLNPDWILIVGNDEIKMQYHFERDYESNEYNGDLLEQWAKHNNEVNREEITT